MLTCIIRDKIKEIKIAAIKKHCNGFSCNQAITATFQASDSSGLQ